MPSVGVSQGIVVVFGISTKVGESGFHVAAGGTQRRRLEPLGLLL